MPEVKFSKTSSLLCLIQEIPVKLTPQNLDLTTLFLHGALTLDVGGYILTNQLAA